MDKQKLKRFNTIYPWFSGLSMDLLFWNFIDTLFLTAVKGFNASQIVSLTSVSLIICILLQIPLVKIIKKIGNTNSARLGAFLLLISSVLLTFGPNYAVILMGKIMCEIAFTFQNAITTLKNNLELQGKDDEYIKYKTKGNTIYAAATLVISFVASILFNINNYIPMLLCIFFCIVCFVLSFWIVDYSNHNYTQKAITKKSEKVHYPKVIILIIMSYGLFYPIVNSGQSNGKLLIQQELLKDFDMEKTALIIGGILCVSRVIRLVSNIIFNKIHEKYQDKVGFMLPILLLISLCLIAGGSFIKYSIILKILIMGLGYVIILFIRDPFKVYMQDLILKKSKKEQQQSLLATLDLSRKVVRAIVSLSFTAILIKNPMIVVITILIILSVVEVFISLYLYILLRKGSVIK
ncbi:MAG: hypothetical protein ACI37Z_03625 [Candidatus Gastranaerophilaceae bacterium]